MFLSTGCSLLRAEGFSCSLGVLYGGLGISKLQFLIKKIEIKFPAITLFQSEVINPWIRIRDPDPESGSAIRKNAGSGSALNQCESENLLFSIPDPGSELSPSRIPDPHQRILNILTPKKPKKMGSKLQKI
jgi:hypothetical protein